ncbi:ABC-2 type transporter-domain-containing protein [Xylariaceae sp. FL1272]|nr:ABC-2 type transporter-domain-containing protein [Xylariaceae sp. FL1272]
MLDGQASLPPADDGLAETQTKLRIGVTFSKMSVQAPLANDEHRHGFLDYLLVIPKFIVQYLTSHVALRTQILHNFEGIIQPGEMLLVLGRPGSGCATFLKTLAGHMEGLSIVDQSQILYQGIAYSKFHQQFQGERTYVAELDVHFTELILGQTLNFALSTRSNHPALDVHRIISQFGLASAEDTMIGNAITRGLSGGEKRRASLAEAYIGCAQLQCWDNSTRGLDSSTAQQFIGFLRQSADTHKSTVAMSIYQTSEKSYDEFDKVIVLYEGRQIYYGSTQDAVKYFENIGFLKPHNVTTADFLTALTNPAEALQFQNGKISVPHLPDGFVNVWKHSEQARKVRSEISTYNAKLCVHNDTGGEPKLEQLRYSFLTIHIDCTPLLLTLHCSLRIATFPLSVPHHILVCFKRARMRMRQNLATDLTTIIANTILGLIIGSVYYSLGETTSNIQPRSILLFFALILNAFAPAFEASTKVVVVWASRPIVEKHHRYAFYQPFTERCAALICDIPIKIVTCFGMHIPIYFLSNLRRTFPAFFLYWLFMIVNLLTMSMIFRVIGSISRTCDHTHIPMHNIRFPCDTMIPDGPAYENITLSQKICASPGSRTGEAFVNGSVFLVVKYGYIQSHIWRYANLLPLHGVHDLTRAFVLRNFGILLGMMIVFGAIHLLATQYISARVSRGEVLTLKPRRTKRIVRDEEAAVSQKPPECRRSKISELVSTHNDNSVADVKDQPLRKAAQLHWRKLSYDIKGRTILENVNGWLEAGTLTVLMGITGAGKMLLLNVLANRVTIGKVMGEISIGGHQRSPAFQRKLGYVQQDDIHLPTATVREALEFSCLLRQPESKDEREKLAYVEDILDLMDMREYADALIGNPGEGLNLEQRKQLTIAVEMVAQPELLLFVDEPTSGLDSQTAWSICTLLRKLANNGQTILCTLHQPSFQLLTMFDRLLLLGKGGKTLYFGDVGQNAPTVIKYFEDNGALECQAEGNPAEWMINATSMNPGEADSSSSSPHSYWFEKWNAGRQKQDILDHLARLETTDIKTPSLSEVHENTYATSFIQQVKIVSKRTFMDQWRSPIQFFAKIAVSVGTALLNGFSFLNADLDVQGITSLLFSIFFATYLFSYIVQMVVPYLHRATQLFESRERDSRTYSWGALLIANILVEVFWQTLFSAVAFAAWYYPAGLYHNGDTILAASQRGALTYVLLWLFILWASTLSQALGAAIRETEVAMQIGILLYWLSLVFCGVLVQPSQLPQFWIFMYRVSPLTYLLEGLAVAGLSDARIQCSQIETLHIPLPSSLALKLGNDAITCGTYLSPYIETFGGYVDDPASTTDCRYCPVSSVNRLLEAFGMDVHHTWRDVGLLVSYIGFNVLATFVLFWLVRRVKEVESYKEK